MDSRPLQIIKSRGGIQRDGTRLDSEYFTDGQWVRFYRGRPRKMGGYRSVVEDLTFPTRGMYVVSRDNTNHIYLGSSHGVRLINADRLLTSTSSYSVSPSGFTTNEDHTWQFGALYDSTGGGELAVLAHGANNGSDISSTTNFPIYSTLAGSSTIFAPISDGAAGQVSVSGGICVLQPFVFAFGNDGLLKCCNANNINDWQITVGGEADEVNVAATKIVAGLPIRGGGQSPAGLFWALDSIIRVSWSNSTVWNYDPVGASTILSSNGIAEANGLFFWMGVDRFLMYDGKISELPNQMNVNWVFDNLNFAQRQKVWATVIPRWGEIWWHFPYGSNQVECNRAVIFNYNEKTWYDCQIERSSGFPPQTLENPLWAGGAQSTLHDRVGAVTITEASPAVVSWTAHNLEVDQVVKLSTTGYLPVPLQVNTNYYVHTVLDSNSFWITDVLGGTPITTTTDPGGTHTMTAVDVPSYSLFVQEEGLNKIEGGQETAIESFFETSDIGVLNAGQDYNTRVTRIEPDFVQQGNMTLTVTGKDFAQSENTIEASFTFGPETGKIDLREQRRLLNLRFSSNQLDGFYEMGKVIVHTEPGDIRP